MLVVDGYGLRIAVERRHLIVHDGVGRSRRELRLPKVGHGIRRLVALGHSGTVSLEALRWLDRVGIEFLHLDSDGRLLTMSAQPSHDDARLRRAQALAAGTTAGLEIVVELLTVKLNGQAAVAQDLLDAPAAATEIARQQDLLQSVNDLTRAAEIEATAAATYFGAWPGRVHLRWARNDLSRIPEHWTSFNSRRSELSSGSSRNAADPINAILNYLYALAETSCRRACIALGLDPGMGLLHADSQGRDSLALDLIEVVRPAVDSYTLDLAEGHIFRYDDFVERDNGHCRILAPLTHHLAQTIPQWDDSVAPWAERIAHRLADSSERSIPKRTPLTASTRRRAAIDGSEARRKASVSESGAAPGKRRPKYPLGPVCIDCGATLDHHQRHYCAACWPAHRRAAGLQGSVVARATLDRAARGRAISDGKRLARIRVAESAGYETAAWKTEIWPLVRSLSLLEISLATGYSMSHSSRIRRGVQVPLPEQWAVLAAAAERSRRSDASNPGSPTPGSVEPR